jgi:hypothetical protein
MYACVLVTTASPLFSDLPMATHSVNPSLLGHEPPTNFLDGDETENEDEVDQLDSDSDVEEDIQDPDSSGSRIPGQTVLPTTRLENIIQIGM